MTAIKNDLCIVINQSPEEIFQYLSDPENMVEWMSVAIAVRKLSPGTVRVGTMMRATFRFLGRWMDLTFELIERESNRCLTFKSVSGMVPCICCYGFQADSYGRTVVSQEMLIEYVEGVIDLKETVVASALRRQAAFDLQTLKDILEARAPTYMLA